MSNHSIVNSIKIDGKDSNELFRFIPHTSFAVIRYKEHLIYNPDAFQKCDSTIIIIPAIEIWKDVQLMFEKKDDKLSLKLKDVHKVYNTVKSVMSIFHYKSDESRAMSFLTVIVEDTDSINSNGYDIPKLIRANLVSLGIPQNFILFSTSLCEYK